VKGKKQAPSNQQMRTLGEFARFSIPSLAMLPKDVSTGAIGNKARGQVAVFATRFRNSSRTTRSPHQHRARRRERSGYHGEIAVDPSDGSILRVTVIAELKLDNPITSANLAVDYGPVEIGGRTYICPVKSVAVSDVRMVVQKLNFSTGALESTSLGALKTISTKWSSRTTLFRAEMRCWTWTATNPLCPIHASFEHGWETTNISRHAGISAEGAVHSCH